MKVTLRYTDCGCEDGKNVFMVLAKRNISILRIKRGFSIYPKITICVKDYDELNSLIYDLNNCCAYEVSIVKIYKTL